MKPDIDHIGEDVSDNETVKCNFAETGVCGVHGDEVERRQNSQRWQSGISGWAVLITAFVAGSYIYAKEIKDDMRMQYTANAAAMSSDIRTLSKQVDALAQGQARTEERYEALLRAITDMNGNITTLTYMQFEQNKSKINESRKVKR